MENTPQVPDQAHDQVSGQAPAPKNQSPKLNKVLYAIGAAVLLVVLVYGLNALNRKEKPAPTREETAASQAAAFEEKLNALPAEASKEERYNYYLRLARAEYVQGNFEPALKWLDQFPEEDKTYQGVWYTYAQIYKSQDNVGQALEAVKLAVQTTPDNPQPWQLYFELIAEAPAAEQEPVYQEALAKTENDPAIVADYEKFKSGQGL